MSNRKLKIENFQFAISPLLPVLLALLFPLSALASDSRLANAAEKQDRTTLRTLMKQHADVNAPQADGMTALHWAAYLDDLETAKILTKAGAEVKPTNAYGVTPLSLACLNGNEALVELLLDAGTDPNLAEFFARAELKRGNCSSGSATALSADWVTGVQNPRLRGGQ